MLEFEYGLDRGTLRELWWNWLARRERRYEQIAGLNMHFSV